MTQEELVYLMWYSLSKEICDTASAYMKEPKIDVTKVHEDILASLEPKPAPAELMDSDWIDEPGDLSCPECGSQDICKHSLNIDQIEIGLLDAPGHINKKRVELLLKGGFLGTFDFKPFDNCESCLSGKMTKEPFNKDNERATDLLEIVRTDLCGPFSHEARGGYWYFITFTDDFSRYGSVYLMRHKSESFEKFREYQNEVQNQLDRKIKFLRKEESYIARHGTINDVSLYTTSIILGTCAETAAHILNRAPTKSVEKTLYELWKGKKPKMSFLKIWGCEVYVRRPTSEKLRPKSDKCFFVGFPKTTVGYYFYNPEENKVSVARNGKFLEEKFLSSGNTREDVDLHIVDEDNTVPTVEPEIQHKNVEPQSEPIEEVQTQDLRRSTRVRQEPDRYLGFLVSQFGGDLNEPTSYGEAVSGSESEQWQEAMKAKMQSMYENQVWELEDLPQHCKVVGHKWVFKKKTDMDGNVHTYKPRLVAKGFTQTHAFLNGKLTEDVYMQQPEGFVDPKNPNKSVKNWLSKCFRMKDLGEAAYILGIQIYRNRSKRLIGLSQSTYIDKILKKFRMDESKKGFIPMQHGIVLSKTQCPVSSQDQDKMKSVPYASAIESIIYAMLCTRPDVAYSVSVTSRYQRNPGGPHWVAVKNILKYLRRTKDMFLVFGGSEDEISVTGYSDASFQTDRDDFRSQLGYVFTLNGGAISWKSSKQDTIADSTTEAEYIAASDAAKEAVWLRNFLSDLRVVASISRPIDIFCDNSGAVAQAKEPREHHKSRHVLRKYHLIREIIGRGDVRICKIPTDENVTDPLTKPLARAIEIRVKKYLNSGNESSTPCLKFTLEISRAKGMNLCTNSSVNCLGWIGFGNQFLLSAARYSLLRFPTVLTSRGCKIDRKSTTGGCQPLGGKLVSWTSKKQNSVSTSTTEAEYVAAGICCAQVLWMRNQLPDYDIKLSKIPIYYDNTSTIAIANNPVLHYKTKHIEVRYHFIRDHVMNDDIEVHFVPTEYQLADLFTKLLDVTRFNMLISELGMLNPD
ncbi:hypothetical protein OSB04_019728 [Centaurea solstitialis]|uniref:Retrotransposon protein, putative, Ty1-copia subclass n=1 Tax=Centaurea solstitialis TaxID=347529 RepID=A0AA38SQV7_9ASTR|nr:hypothetical protein OSB04_019728 [Centaurea solstitialis]